MDGIDLDQEQVTCESFKYSFGEVGSFDDSQMTSFVSDLNLVCDKAWIAPFIVSIRCVSGMIFSPIGSYLSDKYGRKPAMIFSALLQTGLSLPMAFMPTWWSFMILDTLLQGVITVGFTAASVYLVEILGPSKACLEFTMYQKFVFDSIEKETLGNYFFDYVQPWIYCTFILVLPVAKVEPFHACYGSHLSALHTNFVPHSRVASISVEYWRFCQF